MEQKELKAELQKSTRAQERSTLIGVIQTAQLARQNGLLKKQIDLQEQSNNIQSFMADISVQNLSLTQEMSSQLNDISTDTKIISNRAEKESAADELNSKFVELEKTVEKLEKNNDRYSLIVFSYSLLNEINKKNIRSSLFTNKSDMKEFEEFKDKLTSIIDADKNLSDDCIIHAATLDAVSKLRKIIAQNEKRTKDIEEKISCEENATMEMIKDEYKRFDGILKKPFYIARKIMLWGGLFAMLVGAILSNEGIVGVSAFLLTSWIVFRVLAGIGFKVKFGSIKDEMNAIFGEMTKKRKRLKELYEEKATQINYNIKKLEDEIAELKENIERDQKNVKEAMNSVVDVEECIESQGVELKSQNMITSL